MCWGCLCVWAKQATRVSASTIIPLCTSWLNPPTERQCDPAAKQTVLSTTNDFRKVNSAHDHQPAWKVRAAFRHPNPRCWLPDSGLHFPAPGKLSLLCDSQCVLCGFCGRWVFFLLSNVAFYLFFLQLQNTTGSRARACPPSRPLTRPNKEAAHDFRCKHKRKIYLFILSS